jgi:Glycosyltransferase 61
MTSTIWLTALLLVSIAAALAHHDGSAAHDSDDANRLHGHHRLSLHRRQKHYSRTHRVLDVADRRPFSSFKFLSEGIPLATLRNVCISSNTVTFYTENSTQLARARSALAPFNLNGPNEHTRLDFGFKWGIKFKVVLGPMPSDDYVVHDGVTALSTPAHSQAYGHAVESYLTHVHAIRYADMFPLWRRVETWLLPVAGNDAWPMIRFLVDVVAGMFERRVDVQMHLTGTHCYRACALAGAGQRFGWGMPLADVDDVAAFQRAAYAKASVDATRLVPRETEIEQFYHFNEGAGLPAPPGDDVHVFDTMGGKFRVLFYRRDLGGSAVANMKHRQGRAILNGDAIADWLRARNWLDQEFFARTYGVDLGSMAPEEQVRVLSQVDILIAAHGSALSGAIFMQPDSAIIELEPAAIFEECWATLAAGAQLLFYTLQPDYRRANSHCKPPRDPAKFSEWDRTMCDQVVAMRAFESTLFVARTQVFARKYRPTLQFRKSYAFE